MVVVVEVVVEVVVVGRRRRRWRHRQRIQRGRLDRERARPQPRGRDNSLPIQHNTDVSHKSAHDLITQIAGDIAAALYERIHALQRAPSPTSTSTAMAGSPPKTLSTRSF